MRMLLCFALSILTTTSLAQERYPSKPVRLISSGSPGTALDIISRMYAEKLSQRWGQQVVVENRGGAGGTIASQALAKAPPDGYTLLIVNNAHAINPTLYASLPYDTLKEFSGVALLADSPAIVAAAPQMNLRTLKELIALAKQQPGALNFGSGGVGTSVHIVGEYFASQAGVRLVHIPYKTAGDVNTDLMTGRIQLSFGPIPFHLAHVRSGRMLALAVTSAERVAILPDVPTVAEAADLPGFQYGTWYGLIAPAQTPRPVLELLAREIQQAGEQPDVRERMSGQGMLPRRMTLEEFDGFIRAEIDKLGRIVRASGAKAN